MEIFAFVGVVGIRARRRRRGGSPPPSVQPLDRPATAHATIRRFWAAPQLSEGSMSQLNPDTSVSLWDGEVPYIR